MPFRFTGVVGCFLPRKRPSRITQAKHSLFGSLTAQTRTAQQAKHQSLLQVLNTMAARYLASAAQRAADNRGQYAQCLINIH